MSSDPLAAIDPRRSAVVEACAGSGKTWLLVSRIIRALLDGTPPARILAITYTRKAAREIEERLQTWLRDLAGDDEAQVLPFLRERGLDAAAARAALPRARQLFEQVLTARPGPTIGTFHGWFAQILFALPLASEAGSRALVDAEARLRDEVWQLFAQRSNRAPDAPPARSLRWLLAEVGLDGTRKLLHALLHRRAEWRAYAHAAGGEAALLMQLDAEAASLDAEWREALHRPTLAEGLAEYAALRARQDTEAARKAVAGVEDFHAAGDDAARLAALQGALLTGTGTLRQLTASKAFVKQVGQADADRMLALHGRLGEEVLHLAAARQAAHAGTYQRHALAAGDAWLAEFERFKARHRQMDYADLELEAAAVLEDPGCAPLVQARLDARYRQILLDEFQDTNPLQWRVLQAWLDAYGPAARDEAPRVFVVGDPKQSIYRFRRAEPRIFEQARDWFGERFDAIYVTRDTTRRSAPPVVDLVNAVFAAAQPFPVFRSHDTTQGHLPGRVELLPLVEKSFVAGEDDGSWRDLLDEPRQLAEDLRRAGEAEQLVARLAEVVGRWPVVDGIRTRAARWDDVLVLARRRASLAHVERALRGAGVAYFTASRGGLLDTLEARDLAALLSSLAAPGDDLALAHALRSPLFACSHADLNRLAQRGEAGWWERLQAGSDSPALERAAALLRQWRGLAAELPVHDLLDRIFHQGDVAARYRGAVPAGMWPGVSANLDAFLQLALELDGGRFPSLPRFVDELRRLRSAADEAPDEGQILPDGDATAGGRVRLLTVHAAKGLEAPIVWLADAAGEGREDAYDVLLDWPPEASAPRRFSVSGPQALQSPRDEALRAEARLAREREDWTLLYVALTRARQYLFASGVKSGRVGARDGWHGHLAAALEALAGPDAPAGTWPAPEPVAVPVMEEAVVPAPPPVLPEVAPVGLRLPAATESAGQHFGTAWHGLLEALAEGRPLPAPPLGVPAAQWQAACTQARHLVQASPAARFFDPRLVRRAACEVELAAGGELVRLDRLVELDDALWVLDYKTGQPDAAELARYQAQLAHYRVLVAPLANGKPVRTALVMMDGHVFETHP